jgi:hypothetical protein
MTADSWPTRQTTLTCTAAPLSEGGTLLFNYRRRAMVAAVAC